MDNLYFGIDIGGTKCAVVVGNAEGLILRKTVFPTGIDCDPFVVTEKCISIMSEYRDVFEKNDDYQFVSIGISCGGPLDSISGIIQSPPNLPKWIDFNIVDLFQSRMNISCYLENDANACALAEWKFGAGRGYSNVVFLTFGTGLGAGLILDGKLYRGANGNAGEAGHVRLTELGPYGYFKHGSFEGWCSGGGIREQALDYIRKGLYPESELYRVPEISAKAIFELALHEDSLAAKIVHDTAFYLGRGLSMIIDLLNPEVIVIGSIYARAENQLCDIMNSVIDKETLPLNRKVCRVLPAELSESLGDHAALSIALTGKC